jgi:hypothetical protein
LTLASRKWKIIKLLKNLEWKLLIEHERGSIRCRLTS